MQRDLLMISRELAAMAQSGLTYTKDEFDRERFERLREIAGELLAADVARSDFVWPTEMGYATPKVDVRALVFRDEKVLLVREVSSGKWTAPGGWADVNFSPAENVERECFEESGFEVKAKTLTSVVDRERAGYPRNAHSIYKMYFLCEITGGVARASSETSAVQFFALDALPDLDADRVSAEEIAFAFKSRNAEGVTARFN